ncbi:MAG: serine/threonine protein kinase [Myxococcales bacterium]|nr:serine/threonine protein kinase [Myxococcales bacterium]MCB9713554.1 serine/threonine protein kinase [Myxococcales bacterium]
MVATSSAPSSSVDPLASSATLVAPASGIETLAASNALGSETTTAWGRPADNRSLAEGTLVGRTTVLPRVVAQDDALLLEPQLRDRYARVRRLGEGAMGEVELSEDQDIGRRVALKRLGDDGESPAAVARFVDEVRTMGSLDHPNITPIYDVGRDHEGRLFFTMKYVEGESLESLIGRLAAGDRRAHAQYPLARRLDVFVGILHALGYAHAQGILHRDIKPANVMLGTHGEVRLMDWGIARRGSRALLPAAEVGGPEPATALERPEMTHDGALLGTPLYMSPEQARGDVALLDARSDLYSVFVVLYELLTLRRYVREEDNLYATLKEVMEGEGPWDEPDAWLHPTQPPVPVELRYFLRRGLQRDPGLRFGDAGEVLDELEQLRSGEIHVECAVTFFKAQQHRISTFADARPGAFMGAMTAVAMGMLGLLTLAGVGLASLV